MTITVNARKAATAALALLVLLVVYLLGSAHAASPPVAAAEIRTVAATPGTSASGITVSGLGKVTGKPDTLRLDLTVSATAPTVKAALALANGSEAAVQKSLLGNGVSAKDLQTSGLSIQPQYTYSKSSGNETLTGYQVTESVTVALRDLSKAGDAIGAAVSAGGNSVRINSIALSLEDTSSLVSGARDQAFTNAKAKAEQYAKSSGRALGDVVTISEAVQSPAPQPYAFARDQALALAGAAVPIQAGTQDVNVVVTVEFSFR